MNKKKLYDKVNVYPNAIKGLDEILAMLKDSEFSIGGKYYFNEWQKWYEIGTMMNTGMPDKGSSVGSEYDEIDHAKKQKDFISQIQNAFYECTSDYLKEFEVTIPNPSHSGISLCKYNPTKNPEYFALAYHTDTHEFDEESPGAKFRLTCTIYLNDDYEGGEISFLNEEDAEVVTWRPNAGDVIVFPSGSPFFHGVHPVLSGNRYIVRLWWYEEFAGSKEWHDNLKKYGEEEWKLIEKQRIKEAFESGKYHRHVVYPESKEIAAGHKSVPFYWNKERRV